MFCASQPPYLYVLCGLKLPISHWENGSPDGFLTQGYPQSSSISGWDFAWNKPSSYWDSLMAMETSRIVLCWSSWSPSQTSCPSSSRCCWWRIGTVFPSRLVIQHGTSDKCRIPSGKLTWLWKIANLWWFFPVKMVMFHSYVKLPEGKCRSEAGKIIEKLGETKTLIVKHGTRMVFNSCNRDITPIRLVPRHIPLVLPQLVR